ncbi:TonB-dependent receptor domain-containing protein [Sphingomonas sp. Leaf242]|uniref:TonB-dependent receptor domain-containing protein n=1 Tax=Sphingomonas sp. Leaf242 TaxID=1736304 RepID=UPI00138F3078|nr:TonB-dependent receptor [Sphingomonas sp. Leaf242]
MDYRLRKPSNEKVLSVVAGLFAYGAPTLQIDGQIPVIDGTLGVSVGASIANEEYYDGSNARYINVAIIPRWQPAEGIEIVPFFSAAWGAGEKASPLIQMVGNILPPHVRRRNYFGQKWTGKDSLNANHGLIAKANIDRDWTIAGGVFHSEFTSYQNFAELFTNTDSNGLTYEQVVADPKQQYSSISGELRATRSIRGARHRHLIHVSIRARSFDSRYGGSASPLNLEPRQLGVRAPVPRPLFVFGERTHDTVNQNSVGVAYEGRWLEVGELNIGIQHVQYRKTVAQPFTAEATTRDRPWLLDAAGSFFLSPRLVVYAGYTRGLEESGIAPNNAINRNEALPAIRTRQSDAGIRWTLNPRLKIVAGVFDVRKPYFSTDVKNVYTTLGDVRHRGIEMSASGKISNSINMVIGSVILRPEVTGDAVNRGVVGKVPLNQPSKTFRANLDWHPQQLGGLSFDLAAANFSKRAGSRDNSVWLPAYSSFDFGARYQFKMDRTPAMVRFLMSNVADTYFYDILGSNTYGLTDGRRMTLSITADL